MEAVMGGGTAENDEVDRERREGEKSLDLLKVFLIYCLCLFFPSHFTSSHIPLRFSFSSSIRGPVQFVSRIVSRSLRFFLWKIERCVCGRGRWREWEKQGERTDNSTALSSVKLSWFLSSVRCVTENSSSVLHGWVYECVWVCVWVYSAIHLVVYCTNKDGSSWQAY